MSQTTHPADWQQQDALNRRTFLQTSANGLGAMALGCLLGQGQPRAAPLGQAHFAPKAKRVIYLFQSGGPAQMDLLIPSRNSRSIAVRNCRTRFGAGNG